MNTLRTWLGLAPTDEPTAGYWHGITGITRIRIVALSLAAGVVTGALVATVFSPADTAGWVAAWLAAAMMVNAVAAAGRARATRTPPGGIRPR